MADPPNPGRGNYYNVYIHHNADDDYPNEWAQVILDAKASLKITLSVRRERRTIFGPNIIIKYVVERL